MTEALSREPWRRRLVLPAYKIADAARYADISAQTVAAWHKRGARKHIALSEKDEGVALSYLQLIEVAVVAAFRKAGIALPDIRNARSYLSTTFKSEFPFAEFEFKRAGKRLLIEYEQVEGAKGKGKFLRPDQGGQLVWEDIFGALQNFDYEGDGGIVLRWHVAGRDQL